MNASQMGLELTRRDLATPPAGAAFDGGMATRCTGRRRWDDWLYRADTTSLVSAKPAPANPAPTETAAERPRGTPARRKARRRRRGNHRRRHRLVELVDIIRAVRIVPWT